MIWRYMIILNHWTLRIHSQMFNFLLEILQFIIKFIEFMIQFWRLSLKFRRRLTRNFSAFEIIHLRSLQRSCLKLWLLLCWFKIISEYSFPRSRWRLRNRAVRTIKCGIMNFWSQRIMNFRSHLLNLWCLDSNYILKA